MRLPTTALLITAIAAFLGAIDATSWAPGFQCSRYSGKVFTATASNRRALTRTINKYRKALGGIDNGNNPGPLPKGHRSINWDAPAVPFDMPFDFFKNTVTRGIEFHTFDNKFAVSNPSSGPRDIRFSSFDPMFPKIFKTFSPKRLFTSVKSNDIVAFFSVPGVDGNRGSVKGFGAIFTNVVIRYQTRITYFDKDNCPIVTVTAPPKGKGLSFVGVIVSRKDGSLVKAAVASARMTLGNGIVSEPYSPGKNFVVVDDLLYGEPQDL